MNRKKVVIIYFLLYFIFVAGLIFILNEKKKSFNNDVLNEMVNSGSKFMPKITDLCQIQLLGEPKVGKEYVKINIYCRNGAKAMSTLALNAFSDRSIYGVLNEYGKIVNFDGNLSDNSNLNCKIDGLDININNGYRQIQEAATIDCFQLK